MPTGQPDLDTPLLKLYLGNSRMCHVVKTITEDNIKNNRAGNSREASNSSVV